jgi:hypothetical protein
MNGDVLINKELAEKLLNFSIKTHTKFNSLEEVKKDEDITYRVINCIHILGESENLDMFDDFVYLNTKDTLFKYQEFLENFEENLNAKQYKKLLELVTDKVERETDYYGGFTYARNRKVNVQQLSELLNEFNVFQTDEQVTFNEYVESIKKQNFNNSKTNKKKNKF